MPGKQIDPIYSLDKENTNSKSEHFLCSLSGSCNITKLCSSENGKTRKINSGSKLLEMQFMLLDFSFPLSLKKKKKKSFTTLADPGFTHNMLLLKNRVLMATDFS